MFKKEWINNRKISIWDKLRLKFIRGQVSVDVGGGDDFSAYVEYKKLGGVFHIINSGVLDAKNPKK